MGKFTVPSDDDGLEMEELEGLVAVNTLTSPSATTTNTNKNKKKRGGGRRKNRKSASSSGGSSGGSGGDGSSGSSTRKNRVALFVGLIAAVAVFVMMKADTAAVDAETDAGEGDVEVRVPNPLVDAGGGGGGEDKGGADNEDQPKNENVAEEEGGNPDGNGEDKEKEEGAEGQEQQQADDAEEESEGGGGAGDNDEGEGGEEGTNDGEEEGETEVETSAAPPDEEEGGEGEEDEQKDEGEEEEEKDWGHWKFYDGDESNRPEGDYMSTASYRDVTADDFPNNAWQTDAVYVNHFLNDASQLLQRAREAIYTEYGHGRPIEDPELAVLRAKMFKIERKDLSEGEDLGKGSGGDSGGWTSKRSFQGLVRRLLHAMMTNDTFTVVLGGHSAAAGHGNHFNQSYVMQFHNVMEPIFERLGVRLITRNMAQGGLGTIQSALGSSSIYGDEIDVILWDSHMTEPDSHDLDVFYRQAIHGSNRVPFLLGIGADPKVLQFLHNEADCDVGMLGTGMMGVPETQDEVQVQGLPYAAQHLKCVADRSDLCSQAEFKFRTKCWVDRDDVTPAVAQDAHAGSQVKWHPGFRQHQLTGRVLTSWILEALQVSVERWTEVTIVEGDPLPDEYWHIGEYYDNIRSKLGGITDGPCEKRDWKGHDLGRVVCKVGMQGRTEYTPRSDPDGTSLVSILKPAPPNGYVPANTEELLYDGPDVTNPALEVPEGAINVREIVSARLRRQRRRRRLNYWFELLGGTILGRMQTDDAEGLVPHCAGTDHPSRRLRSADDVTPMPLRSLAEGEEGIVPGRGWSIQNEPSGYCDGTMSSICNRNRDSKCLLSGHNDGRGALVGDALSGWLVLTLKDVREGLIVMNHDWYHPPPDSTKGWTEVNDGVGEEEVRRRRTTRQLKGDPVPPKEGSFFEFAIDGKVTKWDHKETWDRTILAQRVVILQVLLNDENFVPDGESRDVELAIRLTGCEGQERECVLAVNHIYWA